MIEAISKQELAWAKLQDEFQGIREVLAPQCPDCYSMKGQWRGHRRTKTAIVHRRWCSNCGRWFIGSLRVKKNVSEEKAYKERFWKDHYSHDAWIEAYAEGNLSDGLVSK